MVGFAAGGPQDILGRLFGQWLSERLGQQFVIENRAGAAGNIAAEVVIRSPADGYTLLMVGPPNAINASLYDKLNFIRDIAPIAAMTRVANVLEVHPSIPARTVPELIAFAKANPGKLNMASAGIGTSQHISGELFKVMTGVDMQHVPYRGSGPALTDLIGGQVQVMFDNTTSSIGHIRAGKLRPLAVTTTKRWEGLPETPTVAEFVPGYEASGFAGIGAPRKTPADIIDRLNKELNAGLADSNVKTRIVELGGTVLGGSPAEFATILSEAIEKWARVIKFAGIKVE
jgi:tripartite-type tricarboxylate transporter receptor subunit TctC